MKTGDDFSRDNHVHLFLETIYLTKMIVFQNDDKIRCKSYEKWVGHRQQSTMTCITKVMFVHSPQSLGALHGLHRPTYIFCTVETS